MKSLAMPGRVGVFAILILAGLQSAPAQSQLGIRLTPTVSVSGVIGTWQQIQYSDDLSGPTNWAPLTNLLLTQTPTVYTDTLSTSPHRFYRTVTLTNVLNTNMIWIPPGTFLMGSPTNEAGRNTNETQTLVTLTQGFFINMFEVTQLEFVSVTGVYPIHFLNSAGGYPKVDSFAVGGTLWGEATNYCDLLTQRDLASFRIPPGYAYRLPTEAEWEYACRAGSTTVFAFGNGLYNSTNQGGLASFYGTAPYPPSLGFDPTGITNSHPNAVGSYLPNTFGLFDMHGNVDEWCLDTCATGIPTNYPGGSVTNPVAIAPSAYHIYRGGDYSTAGILCRSAARASSSGFNPQYGFRVVLSPVGP